jgi:hypothetical protein
VNLVKNSLIILQYRASGQYEYVKRYAGVVECKNSNFCGLTGAACIKPAEDPPTIYIPVNSFNVVPEVMAGYLVHEACHEQQYRDYILSGKAANGSYEGGWMEEKRCCLGMRQTWDQIGVDPNTYNFYLKMCETGW